MNYSNIMERTKLSSIRAFLMHGGTETESPEKTYQEKLEKANDTIEELVKGLCQNKEKCSAAIACIYEQLATYENVYFEIGLLMGTKIGAEMKEKLQELNLEE